MLNSAFFLWIVFGILSISLIIQLIYYLNFYRATVRYEGENTDNSKQPSVSVIICSRNEEKNLKEFLPAILEQDYPDYEVIVVNDCSEDNTFEVIGEYMQKYPHLKVSNIAKDPKFTHFKKFALFIGIKAAKNDILLFTDADCKPESNKWISSMVRNFSDSTEIVLGYGGYMDTEGLLNKYIRYDTVAIALQYLGMAIKGHAYMGVGRNLAYRKSLFFKSNGFGSHSSVISGDDDLFVNENATDSNVAIEISPESFTRSVPCSTLKEWIAQKRRHFLTAPLYKSGDKFLLFLEPLSRILFYASFIVLLCFLFQWKIVLGLFLIRFIVQLIIYIKAEQTFDEEGLVVPSLFFDILSPIINGVIYITNVNRKKQNKWQ